MLSPEVRIRAKEKALEMLGDGSSVMHYLQHDMNDPGSWSSDEEEALRREIAALKDGMDVIGP